MERQLAAVSRLLEQQDFASEAEANAFLQQLTAQGGPIALAPETPLDEAQELIYQALEARGKRRETLARQALAISPDCADAYVLLAEATTDPHRARDLYEQAKQAGERAIGPEMFAQLLQDHAFWSYIESRPYMRARMGLSDVLWALDERQAAINEQQEMLRLNPGDNQGVRYGLLSRLLIVGDDLALKQAEKLLKHYPDEMSAFWAYNRLLLTLLRKGGGREAEAALEQAMDANPFVPFYLVGALPPPKQMPEYYGMGDQNEAITYLAEGGAEAWATHNQHILWLAESLLKLAPTNLFEESDGESDGEAPPPPPNPRQPRTPRTPRKPRR